MSKLFSLKEWVTVEEAVSYLALMLGEEVQKKDLFRLVLDDHLVLSVNFVNHTRGRVGTVGGEESIQYTNVPEMFRKNKDVAEQLMTSVQVTEHEYVNFEGQVSIITGVWDLMMIGSEAIDVEFIYQQLTGGPEVELTNLEGCFVRNGDTVCNLVESFEKNEFMEGSNANKDLLEQQIRTENLSEDEAKARRDSFDKEREGFLQKFQDYKNPNNYYPAGKLPDDAVFVVRTDALVSFTENLIPESETAAELHTKERQSLLLLIAVLANQAGVDLAERGATATIARMTEEFGAAMSEDTVRKYLKQVGDALEARIK